jgi:hypothetical protein
MDIIVPPMPQMPSPFASTETIAHTAFDALDLVRRRVDYHHVNLLMTTAFSGS